MKYKIIDFLANSIGYAIYIFIFSICIYFSWMFSIVPIFHIRQITLYEAGNLYLLYMWITYPLPNLKKESENKFE